MKKQLQEFIKWCEKEKEKNLMSEIPADIEELISSKAAENMVWGIVISRLNKILNGQQQILPPKTME